MKLTFLKLTVLSFLATLCQMGGAQQLGTVRGIVRQVQLQSEGGFRQVKLGQEFTRGQQLRTLRRSQAILKFNDTSELRVNERTDLVLRPTSDLVRYRLNSGAVWLKVPKGLRVEIETPVMTAAVRGTEFELNAAGELRVYDGEVMAKSAQSEVAVGVNEVFTVAAGKRALRPTELPLSHGGPNRRWWETILLDRDTPAALNSDPALERTLAQNLQFFDAQGSKPQRSGTAWAGQPAGSDLPSIAGFGLALASAPHHILGFNHGEVAAFGGDASLGSIRTDGVLRSKNVVGDLSLEARGVGSEPSEWQGRIPAISNFQTDPSTDGVSLFSGRSLFIGSTIQTGFLTQGMFNSRLNGSGVTWNRGANQVVLGRFFDESGARWQVGYSHFVNGSRLNVFRGQIDQFSSTEIGLQIPLYAAGIEIYSALNQSSGSADIYTAGLNFSGLFDATGLELAAEYQSQSGVGQIYGLRANFQLTESASLTALHGRSAETNQTVVGIRFRF